MKPKIIKKFNPKTTWKIYESKIENDILEYLHFCGYPAFKLKDQPLFVNGHFRKPSKFQINGVADIFCPIENGVGIWIEVKRPGNYQSPAQKDFEAMLKKFGHKYFVVRSVKEVEDVINCARRERLDAMRINIEHYEDCHGEG